MDPLLSDYYNVQCFGAQIRLQSPSIELVDARPAQPCCLTQPSLVKLLCRSSHCHLTEAQKVSWFLTLAWALVILGV